MDVVGYSDPWSVKGGEVIRFMVSCTTPRYESNLVRLSPGYSDPRGRGIREQPIPCEVDGEHEGRAQEIRSGSYVVVPDPSALTDLDSFTLQAWVFPTLVTKSQGIITRGGERGYGLFLTETGAVALLIVCDDGSFWRIDTGRPLRAREWYCIVGAFDASTKSATLCQQPERVLARDTSRTVVESKVDATRAAKPSSSPILIGAHSQPLASDVGAHFNGKIDCPRIFRRAFASDELALSERDPLGIVEPESIVAAWDFASDPSVTKIEDTSRHALHGYTENNPMRAVTGYRWTGREPNFQHAPSEYSAIHFHEDDLDDARWEVDFEWSVPGALPSGIYAMRLRAGASEDHIPFFIRPKTGEPSAEIAVLMPTLTYMAYANEHAWAAPVLDAYAEIHPRAADLRNARQKLTAEQEYMTTAGLLGLYDYHSDGTGAAYSSRRRPVLTIRPGFVDALVGGPNHLSLDLELIGWLEAQGHRYDILTDEDLHHEGNALLQPYAVVVSGSHPEYWTEAMLNALDQYVGDGGKVMYLGGNGFYWVTSIDPTRPYIIEVRRGQTGNAAWYSDPGENYHSTTGELGGLWRLRGRIPQAMVGVGFTAAGWDEARPYFRTESSFDPRAAFIFEGIEADEPIGNFGLVLHGAAGLEIDRADEAIGTPPHALVVASANGFSDYYLHVIEETLFSDDRQGGTRNPLVRADMVYFETNKGGAVFAVGSIAWCGSLAHNAYKNNVSRITENVLRGFLRETAQQ